MILKLGLLLASPFILATVVFGATGVVLVDVQEEDGMHIVIPVPILLAQAALSFAPNEAKYVEAPEFAPYMELADSVLEELQYVEDFTMVEIEDGDDSVMIRKVGDELLVDVSSRGGEQVLCRVPIKGAARVLASYDGYGFTTKSAVAALRSASRGDLVHVQDGGDTVRIRKL